MRPEQQIRINTLLLAREEQFVRIHEIEHTAAALLREPYPFTRPALPSDLRAKRKPSGSGAGVSPVGVSKQPPARDPLRRLEGLETAYRVTYRRGTQTVTEDHDDLDALRTLLRAQSAALAVTRIETIDLGARTKAVLFERTPTAD